MPFLKNQVERDLDRELAHHLELKTLALVAQGLSAEDARREAEKLFGDRGASREACLDIDLPAHRRAQRVNALAELAQDTAFALRALRRNLQSTVAMIAILAIGIGATTAVYSLYNAVVLSPLATGDTKRLVWITNTRADASDNDVTTGAYFAWRGASQTLQHIATVASTSATLLDQTGPVRLEGAVVGNGFLSALEIRAEVGRTFADRDFAAGEPPTVMLSRMLWRSRFNGDSTIVGRTITLDGVLRTVVGVMPPDADLFDDGAEFWLPSRLSEASRTNFVTPRLQVVGLLKPGTTPQVAERELTAILARADTRADRTTDPVAARVVSLEAHLGGPFRSRLLLVFGAVACVLAVGCANVASLLIVRGVARQRELAIRASLGASRGRIIRQLLTENLLLAIAAGAVGVCSGQLFLSLIKRVLPEGVPHLGDVRVDAGAALFALAVTGACSVLVGLLPALRVSRVDVRSSLQSGGRGQVGGADRLRRTLMIGEVCVATLLLVTASLLTRSAIKLDRVPLGFSADDVLTARVSLPRDRYESPDAVIGVQSRLLEQLRAANGAAPVALVSRIPLVNLGISYDFGVSPGIADQDATVNGAVVLASPDYFRTMRMALVTGRDFSNLDQRGSPRVAIVNEAMARRLQLGDRALGARIVGLGDSFNDRAGNATPWEIVGIASDTRDWGARNDSRPQVYLPYTQTPDEVWEWVNRTTVLVAQNVNAAQTADALLPRLQRAVAQVDATLPLYDVQPMRDRVRNANATERAYTILLLTLGAAALVLATAGIYAMIAYAVRQRVPEIGVRIALGATPANILRLVLRWALSATSVGIVLGLALSLSATRALGSLLFGVTSTDIVTLAGVTVIMITTALLTCIVPARRALAIAPNEALRSDN
ncbi:MAG: ABC transporter permease [Phycisphaerae bacterium]|nr:ABC transporter permease [Gemmatimonadaceae bacterium]